MAMTSQITPDTAQQAEAAAVAYFDAWKARDWDRLRSVLADTVTFRGPLGQADGADACLEGIKGMSDVIEDIVVLKRFTNGPDVVTWFDLHTTTGLLPTANWSHVEDGRIARIRVTFDPRPLVGGQIPDSPAAPSA